MIIAINGYIGSGKDEVGRIIQYLTENPQLSYEEWKNNILEDGSLRVGPNISIPTKWKVMKFAGKLKQVASLLTGIPIKQFENQEFKKTSLRREWDKAVKKPGKRQDGLFGTGEMEIKQMTVRELLQTLGTESLRDNLHENVWVNALFSDYNSYSARGSEYEFEKSKWIITDCRFPNEAKAIKEKNGIIIRVNRDFINDQFIESGKTPHSSEIALDDWDFDYVIDNDGDINQLISKVKIILDELKIT